MTDRQEVITSFKDGLDEMDQKIDHLEKKIHQGKQDVQRKVQDEISAMKSKRQEIKEKIAQMKTSSEKAFTELKGGVGDALHALGLSYESAKNKIQQSV